VPPFVVLAVLGSGVTAHAAPAPTDRLPDIVQEPPSQIQVSRQRGRDLLSFRSAVHNAGEGPVIIEGRRRTTRIRDMRADQLIEQSDGSRRRIRGVGIVRYVPSADHSHWHFLPFERYELFRPGSTMRVVRDSKTGFCLGDRYAVEPPLPGAVAITYRTRCHLDRPGRLSVVEGISVGWGDDYLPYLDGQHIDVTGLAAGRYRLVHTANPVGRIVEQTRANNVASVEIRLSRGASGRMRVAVIPGTIATGR
jgi:hypothetical protein